METVTFGALIEIKVEENEERALDALEAAVADLASAMKDLRRATDRFGASMSTTKLILSSLAESLPTLARIEQQRSDHHFRSSTNSASIFIPSSHLRLPSTEISRFCSIPSLPEKTKEFHEGQTAVQSHADWPSAELDGEPLATVLNTGNPFHLSLPANPSTTEQILSFKPAKDSGGADLAELGKTHVKFSDLGSLCGDDEAPQPSELTPAQEFLSVISFVLPVPENSMLDICGQPCSGGKNRQWLLYSLRCPAPTPRYLKSWRPCSNSPRRSCSNSPRSKQSSARIITPRFTRNTGPRSYCSSNRDSFQLQFRPLHATSFLQLQALRTSNWGIEKNCILRQFHLLVWTLRQAKLVATLAAVSIIPWLHNDVFPEGAPLETAALFDDTSWTYLVVLAAVLDNRNAQFYVAHGCFHSQQSLLESGSSNSHCYSQMARTHPTEKSGTAGSHIPRQASTCFNHSFLPSNADNLSWNCCEALLVVTRRILDSFLDFSTREFQAHTAIIAATVNGAVGLDEISIQGKATPERGRMTSPKIKCKRLKENSTQTVESTGNHAQGSLRNMENGGLYGKKLKLDAACDVHDLANHIPSQCMKNSKRSLDGNHYNGEISCRQSHGPCKASRAECGQNACVDEAKGDTEGCLRMEVAELANVTKGKSAKAIQMESGKAVVFDDAITYLEMEVEIKSENGFVHIENQSTIPANIDSLIPKIICGSFDGDTVYFLGSDTVYALEDDTKGSLLELTMGCASIVCCCLSLQPKVLVTGLAKAGVGRTTQAVGDACSVYDVWPSCAPNQAAQGLLPLPSSFSQMGMLSWLLFQVFYGLVGSWIAYIIGVYYSVYCNRREREGATFKNLVIQWFEVLAVLLGPCWKGVGLTSNYILLLFGTVIWLKRTWAHNFGGHAMIRAFMHDMWKLQKFKYICQLATLHLINLEDKVVLMGTAMLRTHCYRLDQSENYGVDGVTNYTEELPVYPATPEIAELYPGWI